LKTCILLENAGDPKLEETKQIRGDLEGEQLIQQYGRG